MLPSRPKAVLISLLASYLLSALLLFILTLVLYRLKLKESQITPAVYALYLISCLAGGLLCGKALRTRRFFWGLLTGMLYFLALLAASVLLRHGQIPELTRMLPVLACCVAGGMIGGILRIRLSVFLTISYADRLRLGNPRKKNVPLRIPAERFFVS